MGTIQVCSWHEAKQLVLAGALATHGVCPVCKLFLAVEILKSIKTPDMSKFNHLESIATIRDGGWERKVSGSYFCNLERVYYSVSLNRGFVQTIKACVGGFQLFHGEEVQSDGQIMTLDDALELADV